MRRSFAPATLSVGRALEGHPSGNPELSREDVAFTKQLVEAGKVMGIPVHDHLILAGTGYTSLAEHGLM
ncbi:MAG TPA: JAB domain-containing protein [Rubricoccaceae bacterium]